MVTDGKNVPQICSVLTAQALIVPTKPLGVTGIEVLPCWECSPVGGTGWGRWREQLWPGGTHRVWGMREAAGMSY